MGCMNSSAEGAARNSIKDWKKAWADIDSWLAPYREKGQAGFEEFFNRVMAGPGAFEESPQYKFMFDQGVKALERSAGATGQLGSGKHRQELMKFGQNMAMLGEQDYLNKWYQSLSPLAQLSEIGLNASNQSGNFRLQTTEGLTNARAALGAAKDAGTKNLFSVGMGLGSLALGGMGLFGMAGMGPMAGLAKTFGSAAPTLATTGGAVSSFALPKPDFTGSTPFANSASSTLF